MMKDDEQPQPDSVEGAGENFEDVIDQITFKPRKGLQFVLPGTGITHDPDADEPHGAERGNG